MNNERIAKFTLEGKVAGKRRVGKPKISWLLTALKDLGEAIETANNHSDWNRLCQHAGAFVPPIRQK